MHGKLRQIGVVAAEHDLLRGRLCARHLEDFRRLAQPAQDLREQRVGRDAECAGEPRLVSGDIGDKLRALGTERTKQHRLGIAFKDRRDIGEVGRCVDRLELAAEAVHETAQPEAIEIRGLRPRLRLLDDAHWLSSTVVHYSGAGWPIINEEGDGLYRR